MSELELRLPSFSTNFLAPASPVSYNPVSTNGPGGYQWQ
jgi:hypothetical protein